MVDTPKDFPITGTRSIWNVNWCHFGTRIGGSLWEHGLTGPCVVHAHETV